MHAEARPYFTRALTIAEREGLRREPVGDALIGLADVARGRRAGPPRRAHFYGRAAELYEASLESDPAEASRGAPRPASWRRRPGERDEADPACSSGCRSVQRGPELERGQASLLLATLLSSRAAERARVARCWRAGARRCRRATCGAPTPRRCSPRAGMTEGSGGGASRMLRWGGEPGRGGEERRKACPGGHVARRHGPASVHRGHVFLRPALSLRRGAGGAGAG